MPALIVILEALLLAADEPLDIPQMLAVFDPLERPSSAEIHTALIQLQQHLHGRGIALVEVASGWRFQVPQTFSPWVSRLWDTRATRYSRATLETLALIAYRQPITRGEIEEVRGVSVSSQIIRTLVEREWIKILGTRELPGRPALYGTTRTFLDDFNLKSLSDLPPLAELRDLDEVQAQLDLAINEQQPSQ